MSERNLTSGEINMLRTVYGNSIDYSKITLDNRAIPDPNAVTIFNTISFPEGTKITPDFSASDVEFREKAWLVHEVAHVWQWQVNDVYTLEAAAGILLAHGGYPKTVYKYSVLDVFNKMNIEQQAAAITDRFLIANGKPPSNSIDSSLNLSLAKAQLNLLLGSFDSTNSQLNNEGKAQPITLQNILDLEHQVNLIWDGNSVLTVFYDSFTQQISDYLSGYTDPYPLLNGFMDYNFGLSFNIPIGAFYDSQNPVNDNSPSISTLTPVLLSTSNKAMTAKSLATLDVNKDGMLNGTELTKLHVWADANENGVADTDEITTLSALGMTDVIARDYGFYRRGNAIQSPQQQLQLTKAVDAPPAQPSVTSLSVPDSNYSSLRDATKYGLKGGYLYNWNGVVAVTSDEQHLIGTTGADVFSDQYLTGSAYDPNKITSYLGGGGNDAISGSLRNETFWGGLGDDFLDGNAGDDKLYGEDGDDEMNAGAGLDTLAGGVGNDTLFGGVGNDVLDGGAGNDILVGFTPSNDPKQSLSSGETDNDSLFGGAGIDLLSGGLGNDTLLGGTEDDLLFGGAGVDLLFGGWGNDELQGGDSNDKLSGEADSDKLFGQTGNDMLWGGSGDDILVGFTAANEAKQALLAGETDDDKLFGGAGDDNLYGDLGKDTLDGGDGLDLLQGGNGDDQLFGGSGDDELQGGVGNDKISGEADDDKLFGQTGNDTLWGGFGNDILVGFTAANEIKQTLAAGESDNDTLFGNAGNDFILGGLGIDSLWGGDGVDELQGGVGNDLLYGEAGIDHLFGQVGNDVIYGGAGNDVLVGFTGANEEKQTLALGETDNDWLYGGSGKDYLLGGLGNDYLDGGAGADVMQGDAGSDIYIVNSVNDSIIESPNEGYDTVISSTNYLLNQNVEELRLLEGLDIHGTGNALDNKIIGNSRNNILDGVTGKDTLIGAKGNDTYYVDNTGDQVVELSGEGTDRVQSSISYVLNNNVEDLVLLDFSKPELGKVDGVDVLVYGYPKMNELDYLQGDNTLGYKGTCALTAIANLLTQAGKPTTESSVVTLAAHNNLTLNNPNLPAYELGGTTPLQQQAILTSYGIRNDLLTGYNPQGIANLIMSGRGVILGVNAGQLWAEPAYVENGSINHAITVTGVVYDQATETLKGFYIADSGRHQVSDMTRFISLTQFEAAANVGASAYAIYTLEPMKLWDEDINGTGNGLDNTLIGNRGNNLLNGGDGDDKLSGGAGNDVLVGATGVDSLIGGEGDDTYWVDNSADKVTEAVGEGADLVKASATYSLSANIENLTLMGLQDIDGTGNGLANMIMGNNGANNLAGLFGDDEIKGGAGNDSIAGGPGNDTLNGGLGDDTLTGGLGQDVFSFTVLLNSTDTITDFSPANDTLQLDSTIFTQLNTVGVLDASLFVNGSTAADGDDYLIYDPVTGILSYDANGNGSGAAIQIALLSSNLTLTNTNFMVI